MGTRGGVTRIGLQTWIGLVATVTAASATFASLWSLAGAGVDAAGGAALVVLTVGLIALYSTRRILRERHARETLSESVERRRDQPISLHPVIDPNICIGSLACLKACPEGDILGVIEGRAALIDPAACIGHGMCSLECPTGAIKLVFGTETRGVDLPEISESFESSRKGVYIIGELGGMGLIRNAMTQGLQLVEALEASAVPGPQVDLAIIGAGPAGLAAALACRKRGLSFRLLDQGQLGGAVYNYPRQKLVMSEPLELPFVGRWGRRLISKEALLAFFEEASQKAEVQVESGTQVTGIAGEDGAFELTTNRGPVAARKVALAIGRRGTPRKLGCPGEELPKVTYALVDASQYDGCHVLVVGGGDSALEAAAALAEESDAQVTLSYRNTEFGRARQANKEKVAALASAGRITLAMGTEVSAIDEDQVELSGPDGRPLTLTNDFVIVCIGGELPTEFLKGLGIAMRRHFGTGPGEAPGAGADAARRGSAKEREQKQGQRRFALALFSIGALVVAFCGVVGWDYYWLSDEARRRSPLHEWLRPAGTWGHGVGIAATACMLMNFLYAARKRIAAFRRGGSLRKWLTFHQFVGFVTPLIIAFHAAFQSNNHLATATAAALVVLVATGILGRYVFGLVTEPTGHARDAAEVRARFEQFEGRLRSLAREASDSAAVERAIQAAVEPVRARSLATMLVWSLVERAAAMNRVRRLRACFRTRADHAAFRALYRRLYAMRAQRGFGGALNDFMHIWRVLHVALSISLVVLITAHIALSLHLGFRWIF